MRSASVFLTIFICVIGVTIYIATVHVLPYSPIRPHRCTREEITEYFPAVTTPEQIGLRTEKLDVTVADTIVLKGWFIHAARPDPFGTVILLHGSASCKEAMLATAETLAFSGCNAVIVDLRAHGESGGMYCTYGYYEKEDVSRIIDEAIKKFSNAEPFAVYGNSLGGAIALQALAFDPRIKCGIIESSFATLREVVYDYMKRISGMPLRFISDKALDNSGIIANFPVDSIRPEESAKNILQPVLIAHGSEDNYISIEYGKRIYRNLASPNKVWYPIEGGDHLNLRQAGGREYQQKVVNFLRTNLRNSG